MTPHAVHPLLMKIELGSLWGRGRGAAVRPAARRGCEYRKSNGAVRVECDGCANGQNLNCPPCFKGVLRILANESEVREVLLARDWEIAYDIECVRALSAVAEVNRFCSGLTYSLPFESCPSCAANPRGMISRVTERLPQGVGSELASQLRPGPHGTACEQCVRTSKNNLEHIASLLSEAERKVARSAFRVVSADERA